MMVPVIAQRTKRIRIGTAVTLLPLQHPLSFAEQAATADVLSGGRLEFGVGRGSIPSQFHGFRIDVAENRARFDEALEIIRLAWTKERFSYRGTFWDVEEVAVVPRPVQRPHPPIRVAVHSAGELRAHRRQGPADLLRHDHHAAAAAPRVHGALPRALRRRRPRWQPEQMALMLPVYVGDREAMRPGVQKYYKNIQAIFSADSRRRTPITCRA